MSKGNMFIILPIISSDLSFKDYLNQFENDLRVYVESNGITYEKNFVREFNTIFFKMEKLNDALELVMEMRKQDYNFIFIHNHNSDGDLIRQNGLKNETYKEILKIMDV